MYAVICEKSYSLGYSLTDSSNLRISRWEDSLYSTRCIRSFSFKSIKPMNMYKNYFMRFDVEVYSYDDTIKAGIRFSDIDRKPPFLLPEENKIWPLRRSFLCGSNVVTAKTDAVLFEESLDSVYGIFRSSCNESVHSSNKDRKISLTEQVNTLIYSEYILKDSGEMKVSKWEDSLFSTKEIKWYSFKSRKPLTGYKNVNFRFSMYIYTFGDSLHAQRKLDNIDLEQPRMSPLYYKSFPMGFRIGKTVFVFMTDTVIFKTSLSAVYQKICTALGTVCDTE